MLPRGLYTYDEADYQFAAKNGIAASYLDKGAISLFSFIGTGLKAGFDKRQWSALSLAVRSGNDVTFYRHFHGPLYFYWLACCRKCGLHAEAQTRYATFLFLLFITGGLAFFIHRLFPRYFLSIALPLLAAFMLGPSMILTVNQVTPHGLYVLLSLACLGFLSLYCATRRLHYWYWSVAFSSLAFLTLEYALFLVLTLLASIFIFRKELLSPLDKKERRLFVFASCACFLAPLLLLWPSGFYKFTIAKNYLFYLYFTVVRGGYYSALSPAQVWWMRLRESPAEYLFIIAAVAALPLILKRYRFFLPVALYGALVLVTTIRNTSTYPRYISSVFPAAYLLAAAALNVLLQGRRPAVRAAIASALVALTAISSCRYFATLAATSLQRMPFQVTSLRDLRPLAADRKQPLFLNKDYVPVLHYYFPDSRLYQFNPAIDGPSEVLKRAAAVLEQGDSTVVLILDAENASLPANAEQTFTISKQGHLFISDLVPAATCLQLSLRKQAP